MFASHESCVNFIYSQFTRRIHTPPSEQIGGRISPGSWGSDPYPKKQGNAQSLPSSSPKYTTTTLIEFSLTEHKFKLIYFF